MDQYFTERAWEDYIFWLENDKSFLKKINSLIKDIKRGNPFEGIGKPEALKHNMSGCWSRRINTEHRLVYKIEDDLLIIQSCRYHYNN